MSYISECMEDKPLRSTYPEMNKNVPQQFHFVGFFLDLESKKNEWLDHELHVWMYGGQATKTNPSLNECN